MPSGKYSVFMKPWKQSGITDYFYQLEDDSENLLRWEFKSNQYYLIFCYTWEDNDYFSVLNLSDIKTKLKPELKLRGEDDMKRFREKFIKELLENK